MKLGLWSNNPPGSLPHLNGTQLTSADYSGDCHLPNPFFIPLLFLWHCSGLYHVAKPWSYHQASGASSRSVRGFYCLLEGVSCDQQVIPSASAKPQDYYYKAPGRNILPPHRGRKTGSGALSCSCYHCRPWAILHWTQLLQSWLTSLWTAPYIFAGRMFPLSSKAFIFHRHSVRYCNCVGSQLEANWLVLAGQGKSQGSIYLHWVEWGKKYQLHPFMYEWQQENKMQ